MSGSPVEPIATVDDLVARFESSRLDYKTTYDLAAKATRYDIAKDVAAFANAFGGAIIVGVVERGGRVVELPGVASVAALTREVATALQQHCVPCPSTPEEHMVTVTPRDAERLLARGAPLPAGEVALVTLNVGPDARAPIGVRPFVPETQTMGDTFRFPVRVDDQTRFMDPTELPMWMNSHERRMAIQLRRMLAAGATDLRAFHVLEGFRTYDTTRYPFTECFDMTLLQVDEGQLTVTPNGSAIPS